MIEQSHTSSIVSSEIIPDLSSLTEKKINNTYNTSSNNISSVKIKNTNTNKLYGSSQRIISNNNKRIDSPLLLKNKDNKESNANIKIKNEINKAKIDINKIIEKYKYFIKQLQYFLKLKDDEITSLKTEIEKYKIESKINKKCFDNLDIGNIGEIIISGKKQNSEELKNTKRIYTIQYLDKIGISYIYKDVNIYIETRDSIEILPTLKTPLKAQKVNEMFVLPLKNINYIQVVDNLIILNNKLKKKKIKIEERDSIEILPTLKTLLKAQKVNQMFIKNIEIPDFLIQNLDNLTIIKTLKIGNVIQPRDSLLIDSEDKIPLQAQHTQNMIIDSIENETNNIISILDNKVNSDILSTPVNKHVPSIRNSIEHIPLKKSPLQLKNIDDLRNKYLKKYNSENKDNHTKKEKEEKINQKVNYIDNYIESGIIGNLYYKPKSNHKYYKYEHISIKPTLKMLNTKQDIKIHQDKNNHRLKEVSYKNQKNKYNYITPKPSILPISKTTKNINFGKNDILRDINRNASTDINKGYNNYYKYIRNYNSNENKKLNITNKSECVCENKIGRNVRVIKTQKNGPSIVEKRFIAHSCEKCNYLNFKKK